MSEGELFDSGGRAQGGRAEGGVPDAIIHFSRRPLPGPRPEGPRLPDVAKDLAAGRLRRQRGITPIEVLAAVMAVVLVLALLIPAWAAARRHGRVAACMDNLRQLHRAEAAWEAANPGRPVGAGRAYWTKLVQPGPSGVDPKALICPLASPPEEPGGCSYWGPSGDPAKYDAKDPLGCDDEINHDEHRRQGGNILRKSGDVVNDNQDYWWSAIRGKCRP